LLQAAGNGERDKAWDDFLAKHSRLLLHVARKVMPSADSAMDAYANILERLRRDECRAIAGYVPDGRSQFTTWLVVVTRRMCVDFYRQRYGRPRGEEPSSATLAEREARRRLANFAGVEDVQAQIADEKDPGPEGSFRNEQLQHALDSSVAALLPEDQLLLKLRFHDDLPAHRIAPILAMPSQFHVYRRLKAVCAELRRSLLARGVEDGTP
jgi:RNA polymerase sigma factor (sigma-70 family)